MLKKPAKNLYHAFYQNYINLAPDADILNALKQQLGSNKTFFSSLPDEKMDYRYQPGKWSINELIGHMCDTERVFAYRALCFARNDKNPLPGFDENAYLAESFFSERSAESLIDELDITRQATLVLLTNFSDAVWERIGNANGSPMVLSALPYIIYGHNQHHRNIIQERYL
ncbi:MAG: DinB family protein [Calditrichaeota bacterium]|nr:DinB family protein [Calditrichota bacterium]